MKKEKQWPGLLAVVLFGQIQQVVQLDSDLRFQLGRCLATRFVVGEDHVAAARFNVTQEDFQGLVQFHHFIGLDDDGDGLLDIAEDANGNGVVDAGETDPLLADTDGDGVNDVAVGAPKDDDGGAGRGAVWLLYLNSDGTVKNQRKISSIAGNFTGALDDQDHFGSAVVGIGAWALLLEIAGRGREASDPPLPPAWLRCRAG